VPEQELDLLQFAATLVTQTGARATEVMRCDISKVAGRAGLLHNAPDDLGTETARAIRPALLIAREIWPLVIFASAIQVCSAAAIQYGTGTVLTWPPLPTRSAKTQWSSRCCKSWTLSAATSARRNPQPNRTAIMAWSRTPRKVCWSNTPSKRFPCSAVSQLPIRTPNFLAPLTHRIPAAKSALSRPASAA